MSEGSALVLALATTAAVSAWAIVWFHIPNTMHSRYRSKLWEIRDDLVDDLIFSRLHRSAPALALLDVLETTIRYVPRHTITDVGIAALMLRDEDVPGLMDRLLSDEVPPSERVRLTSYLTRFADVSLDHLLWGSPSGWTAQLGWRFLRPMLVRRYERELSRVGVRERTARVEIFGLPRLASTKSTLPSHAA